ncbi:universal stress protein [Streptomyces sp. NPDC001606]
MTLPLVVGVDGSDSSLRALDWAADEALRHGLPLRLVHASLWERYEGALPSVDPGRPAEQVMAEHVVASAAERAERRAPGVKVTTDIVPQDAATALVHESDLAALLVTGSRGRGQLAAMLLGSVGLTVAGQARCPVVVVRGDRAGVCGTHGRILLGLGDADTDADAVRFAFREAEARDCALDVVHAWRSPAHGTRADDGQTAAARLDALLADAVAAHPRVRTHRRPREGPAGRILVELSAAADLVIVGTQHRTARLGLQLGPVGHTLLHHAQCPVATVPRQA